MNIENIRFDSNGLIPVVTQDFNTKEVLILSYMNKEALLKTLETNVLYYFSRSRKDLWKKGETSGNTQELIKLVYDCDGDALLAFVIQKGPACHTGKKSCFYNILMESNKKNYNSIINDLYLLIKNRKINKKEGSYTNYLFEEGKDKILKKIGEEASEIIIASKNNSKDELIYEMSDFIYHSLVLLVNDNVNIDDILKELVNRYN